MKNKIVFFGSTNFSAEILKALIEAGYDVTAVVTRTDKARGRGNRVLSTEVKKAALQKGIRVLEYDRVCTDETELLKEFDADYFVVVAYGAILPQAVLDIPKIAPINIHASLLPTLRGASPIESSIRRGHKKTGISYMHMVKELDAGDVYASYETEIKENESFDELEADLIRLSTSTVDDVLKKIADGKLVKVPQHGEMTYADKILKDDLRIDFGKNAEDVKNHINSLDSHIGAYAFYKGERYKLFGARKSEYNISPYAIETDGRKMYVGCADGSVEILRIQAPGKKKMDVASFLLGNKLEGSFDEG